MLNLGKSRTRPVVLMKPNVNIIVQLRHSNDIHYYTNFAKAPQRAPNPPQGDWQDGRMAFKSSWI